MPVKGAAPQQGGSQAREVSFVVPLVPPSVNHYKRGGRGGWSVKGEAVAFKEAVALCAAGQYVAAEEYELEVWIYLGYKQRGDGDNFWKVTADSLVAAGIIHSDAAVKDWLLHVRRDAKNPRTEITVRAK